LHLSDFIQKDGTAFGHFHFALFVVDGAGKRALHVTEQLRFQKFCGNGAAVDDDKGAVSSQAVKMNRPGNQLLSGTRFPEDEYSRICLGYTRSRIQNLQQRTRLSDDMRKAVLFIERAAEQAYLIDQAVRARLQANPDTLVVLVGAGFDSRAFRIPGGRWIEIDEAPIIERKNAVAPVA